MSKTLRKIFSVGLSVTTAVWFFGGAVLVSGATVEELQAQIAALLAQIQSLQKQLQQQSQSQASTASYSFTRDLTLGAKGDDVRALQELLIDADTGPAAKALARVGATGYFGGLTKAALVEYQKAVGISPATGYFGPKTRAYVASLVTTTTTTTTETTTSSTTETTTTTTTTETTTGTTNKITTPGVEAILSAEWAPSPANNTSVKVGESDVAIVGVRVKAKQGDAIVKRLTLSFQNTNPFTKVFDKLALYDGSTKLAEITNLPSAYVKNAASDYRITFSGFNVLVSKDGYKDLTVKGTLKSSIDSNYYNTPYTVSVPTNGVRATDGANIDQYASITTSRSFRVEQSEEEQATLSLAKDASSPKTGILVSDSSGKVEKGTMLVIALSAEKGRVKVTDISVSTTGTANFSALYLYDGSNSLSSASVSNNSATFSDLTDVYVEKDQTKLLTIKADFTGATTSTMATATVSVATSNITAEKMDGTSATVSGSPATSDTQYVTMLAPVITLKNFTASWSRNAQESTGTLTGTLEVDITAKGGDIYISKTAANSFVVVKVSSTGSTSTVASTYYDTVPTNVTEGTHTYKIAKDQTATFKVKTTDTFAWDGKNYYLKTAVGDGSKIDWATSDSSSMGGSDIDFLNASTWRTNTVTAN